MLHMCGRNGGRRSGNWNPGKILGNARERARRDGLEVEARKGKCWVYSLESRSVISTGGYHQPVSFYLMTK